MPMIATITPAEATARLAGNSEIAFLDLREAGPFSEGHPLFALPCPWSSFEIDIGRLVPRRGVPIMLIDGGDGVAEQAAAGLLRAGYTDVITIGGGTPAWEAAGLNLFKGVHVPSKTLGELAEEKLHPKALPPSDLATWLSEGRDFLFFDCRPSEEYVVMSVPGATTPPK